MTTIIREGQTHTLKYEKINDDDWYVYDTVADMVLKQFPHYYRKYDEKMPDGYICVRGLILKNYL